MDGVSLCRRELYHVQRELLREKTRCKALEEELENPMNIHRWRKLEVRERERGVVGVSERCVFPTREVIPVPTRWCRRYTLCRGNSSRKQKRYIHTHTIYTERRGGYGGLSAQVVEKELLIQEKEKLYMELKAILQRQPGPEVAEQLQIYQQTLKEKTKQMKVTLEPHKENTLMCGLSLQSMASELNMYESQVSEYRMDIDRLQREMQEIKKKYFLQKKKEQALRMYV